MKSMTETELSHNGFQAVKNIYVIPVLTEGFNFIGGGGYHREKFWEHDSKSPKPRQGLCRIAGGFNHR